MKHRRTLIFLTAAWFLLPAPSRSEDEKSPLRPLPLPPPPRRLLQPLDREVILKPIAEREIRWSPVEEAVIYHLEISTDPDFRVLVFEAYPTGNSFTVKDLPEGTFYWHISSINATGLEGRFSDTFSFFYPRRSR
ncbi:MAG: hypothetical protein P9M08_04515 [Candidatus Erginobacter occultus]|nr:hypothetical protein [Candidatus Erginobacter occultus]